VGDSIREQVQMLTAARTGKLAGYVDKFGVERHFGGFFTPAPRLSTFGDSWGAQQWTTLANSAAINAEQFVGWADGLLGGDRFRWISNRSISGQNTAQILRDQLPLILSDEPAYALMIGGTNGVYASATAETLDEMKANTTEIASRLIDNGTVPIIATIPARTQGVFFQFAATQHMKYNDWLVNELRPKLGVHVWDMMAVTADPTSTELAFRSGLSWDSPAAHYNNVGGYWLGKSLANLLDSILPKSPSARAGDYSYTQFGSAAAFENLLDNPLLRGSGGTNGTGGSGASIPAGWIVQRASGGGSPTWVVETAPDVLDPATGLAIGKAIRLTITAVDAGNQIQIVSTDMSGRLRASDRVQVEAGFTLSSPVNVSGFRFRGQCDSGAGENVWWNTPVRAIGNLPEGFTIRPKSRIGPLIQGPVASTFGTFDFRLTFSAAGSAVLDFFLPRYRRILTLD